MSNEAIGYELAGSRALFKGPYKLVLNLPPKGTGEWELYDIEQDPSEFDDLSAELPGVVAELTEAYSVYEAGNNVIPVPDNYDPIKQLVKNAQRGMSH